MPANIPDDTNPFAPPLAEIGNRTVDIAEGDAEAEGIRRAYIGRETAVKAIGLLNYGVAFLFGLLGLVSLIMNIRIMIIQGMPILPDGSNPGIPFVTIRRYLTGQCVVFVVAWLGRGLRRLRPWSRWMMLVFASIGLIIALILGYQDASHKRMLWAAFSFGDGGFLFGGMVYLLASPRAKTVFSRDYRAVVARTPSVKYEPSPTLKIVAMIVLAVILCQAIYAVSQLDRFARFLGSA